jgi:hypothetical protein
MSKVLIIGDSFAADWSVKYNPYLGWPNLLAKEHQVTNLAECGVSEYKIYRQLTSAGNLDQYDAVIVSHTSPYRVETRQHPIHSSDSLHSNADLIYSDIEYHAGKLGNFFNRSLSAAQGFFLHHYDNEYYETTYRLYREKIMSMLSGHPAMVLHALHSTKPFVVEADVLDVTELAVIEPGLINHFSINGNINIFQNLTAWLQTL